MDRLPRTLPPSKTQTSHPQNMQTDPQVDLEKRCSREPQPTPPLVEEVPLSRHVTLQDKREEVREQGGEVKCQDERPPQDQGHGEDRGRVGSLSTCYFIVNL